MLGADFNPLRDGERMMIVDPGAEGGSIGWQVFKPDPVFLGRFDFSVPAIVRSDGSVDLRAGGEPGLNRFPGQTVGVDAFVGRCPSHEHAGSFAPSGESRKGKSRAGWGSNCPLTLP